MDQFPHDTEVPSELSAEDLAAVAGGRFKRPGQRPVVVYYDDGVSILTSDPASTNVHPNIT